MLSRPDRRVAASLLCALIIAFAFVFMLWWTWGGWPDPLVDFGRELYIPWQLGEGKVLYRDIAYFNGPLSPHFNALAMKLFGVSLRTIELVNISILVAVIAMMYGLILLIGDRLAATLACLLLITVFSFLQLGAIGNYNFVTPYSHEMTHGLVLSVAAMLCMARFVQTARTIWASGAGLLLGLIFLTKPEVFAASAVALSGALVLALFSRRAAVRTSAAILGQFGASALVAPLIALLLLMKKLPPPQSLRGVLGGWIYLFDPRINQMKFYQGVLGSNDLATTMHAVVVQAVWYAALAGSITAVTMTLRGSWRGSVWLVVAGMLVICGVMSAAYHFAEISWETSFRGVSAVMVGIAVALIVWIMRQRQSGIEPRAVLRTMVVLFALALLAKVFLNVLFYHYGFALAMPAALVIVTAISSWGPQIIDRMGGSGNFARGAAVALVAFVIFVHLRAFHRICSGRPFVVGRGADRLIARDVRGRSVNSMVQTLSSLAPHATLATVPEGVMINFLARRANPTPYLRLMPPEVIMFGQDRIVAAFDASPPDYIVLIGNSHAPDYGFRSLGADDGKRIAAWIERHYSRASATALSATGPDFPLILLQRNE